MSGTNDDKSALADVYAESLLSSAVDAGREEEVSAEFADLVSYMDRDADFDAFLTALSVDDDARGPSLEKLFRGKMDDLLLNLLLVLNRRGRSNLVRVVQRCYEIRIQSQRNQQEVLVETATPLTPSMRDAIKKTVRDRIQKEAILIEKLRPELIGGVVIRVGDEQIDGSVATRIRMMHRRLVQRASEEIHKEGQYVVE